MAKFYSMFQKVLQKIQFKIKLYNRNRRKSCAADTMKEMRKSLNRLRSIGISPKIILDIGAAKGKWTEVALGYFPDAEYVLVEPIDEQIQYISMELQENPKVTIIEGVAGKTRGEVKLTVSPDLDGSGIYGGKGENIRKVKVISVDELIKGKQGNVLLKLDTHGYELPIFEGAKETLKKTSAIIVEVYGFYVSPHGKLFHEISAYLFDRGFRLFDIIDVMRRPDDLAFWQADAIYLRSDHQVFKNNSYR